MPDKDTPEKDTVVANDADTVVAQPKGSVNKPETPLNVPVIPAVRRLSSGDVVGDKYEIMSFLGKGGMCSVYKAKHLTMDRLVALKMMDEKLVKDKDALPRFQREARAISTLEHPNVVGVYGFGVAGKVPYMAIEYLEGISLADLLKQKKRLSKERALPIFTQILDALTHAHGNGIIHRDLKPSNVMLTGSDQVKLVDFGIAKILPEPGKELQRLTQAGEVFGTAAYMSPEQCRGEPLDARSDLYSMGCLMYEVIDGAVPIEGDTYYLTISNQLTEEPRMSEFLADDFGQVVLRALEKKPDDRYQSAMDLKEALLNPTALILKETKQKKKARQWILVAGTIMVAFQIIVALFFFCFQPRQNLTAQLRQLDMEIDAVPANELKRFERILTQVSGMTTPLLGAQERSQLYFSVHHLQNRLANLPPSMGLYNLQTRIVQCYHTLKKPADAEALIDETLASLEVFISSEQVKAPEKRNYEQLEEACKVLVLLCRDDRTKQDFMLAQMSCVESILSNARKYVQAESIAKSALEFAQNRSTISNLAKLNAIENLGTIQMDAGNLAEAELNLLKAWDFCKKEYQPQSAFTQRIGDKLIKCYLGEKKKEEADKISKIINAK